MKTNYIFFSLVWLLVFSACDEEVYVKLDDTAPFLVVDAWLTHTDSIQKVVLSYTQSYYDNSTPTTVSGASVTVRDLDSEEEYSFLDEDGDGTYTWTPSPGSRFGTMDHSYDLTVVYEGITYTASSHLNRVPTIDSITFEYTKKDLIVDEDYYVGDFWARDLPGFGDTYWIKAWKNGDPLNDPDQINIAYDAGFSEGAELDSLIFIQPIRTAISPYDDDDDDNTIPPYLPGDSTYVEIHAITNDAWRFLSRVEEETNRPGGFGELFSTPLSNVTTNIIPSDESVQAAGFFSIASVSALGARVSEETIRDNVPD